MPFFSAIWDTASSNCFRLMRRWPLTTTLAKSKSTSVHVNFLSKIWQSLQSFAKPLPSKSGCAPQNARNVSWYSVFRAGLDGRLESEPPARCVGVDLLWLGDWTFEGS